MAGIIENAPERMVLRSGSTTLTLDKAAGIATLQRKMLFITRKPVECPLSEIADARVDAAVDRASGVEVCHTMLVTRVGEGWALAANDKKDAQATASAIRSFLGLAS
jgi:hypothetical protein